MDKWLYHPVVLICIYLILRKVKQAVIGLRLSCISLHHCDLCVQIFYPFLYRVCGLFVAAFTGSLNVWNKHTISTCSVIMSVISFQFAVCPLIFAFTVFFCTEFYFRKLNLSFFPFSCILWFHVLTCTSLIHLTFSWKETGMQFSCVFRYIFRLCQHHLSNSLSSWDAK